jgi:peptide/nickel transport system substrate-binding protein
MIASVDPKSGRLALVRNPHFRVWSADARPDGYADEIRFRLSEDTEARFAVVEEGTADWAQGFVPGEQRKALLTRHAGGLHSDPSPLSVWLFLNTRQPPFNDPRVRRALNYATDRKRLTELVGGPAFARPTCQILPPGVPGFRPYCPYTLNPNPAGTWTAPDLARAKALVVESGTRRMRVGVVSFQEVVALQTARYFVALLGELGYRSSLRKVLPGFPEYLDYVGDPRNRAQSGQAGWLAATLTASDFFLSSFSCSAANLSQFCDREIEAQVGQAATAQTLDPARANALWAAVDRALVDRAAVVPIGNPRRLVLVSERVGNYQNHPLWGTLLDQLWVE